MPIARAERVAGWLSGRGSANAVGRWLGRAIMNPRNGQHFARKSGSLNQNGQIIRIGVSKTRKGRLAPAIRVRSYHYWMK